MKNKLIIITILFSFVAQLIALPVNVSIVGNVDNPGVYIMDSSNRVSQAIQFIEGGISSDYSTLSSTSNLPEMSELGIDTSLLETQKIALATKNNQRFSINAQKEEEMEEVFTAQGISKRRVILVRNNVSQELNLQEFYLNGDLINNPYLQNDDIIKLLPIERSVKLTGEVNREGEYEFGEGDKISDLITLGQGLTEDADLSNIRIERYSHQTGELLTWTVNYQDILSNPDSAENIILSHNDLVKVFPKPYLNKRKVVEVNGLVKYPGEYSIDDNSTLLSVLESAGGPLNRADLTFAVLIDKSIFESYDPDLERLLASNSTLMSTSEYSYIQTKLREVSGKHYVNIKKLWETKDEKYDRKVKAGDIIYIKEPLLLVNVSGAVQNAGLQPWEEGKTLSYYIQSAGGYIPSAFESKARVIRYDTNVWIRAKEEIVINPGDEIFVPEVKDRTFWDYFTEGLAVTAQVITIVLGVHTLTK